MIKGAIPMSDQPATLQQQPPVLTDEHKLLDAFVGEWIVEGQNKEGAPVAPNAKVIGEENYEKLSGGFFLISHWAHHFGEASHIGVGTVGYDPVKHTYTIQNVDNLGYARTYTGGLNDGKWLFTGEAERVTIAFSDGGQTKTEYWDVLNDDSNWVPLCEMKATKQQAVL
jgi:Protein of unknown function (DUF1579)